jgi:hypothetical protein
MLVENSQEKLSREVGKEAADICLPRVAAPRFRGPQMRMAMVEAVLTNPGHPIADRLIKSAKRDRRQ